ncbi:cholecystokinin receptor type A-like [Haliotis asinina]|uniref:cholecystokinin receptor type A-like n=1 Tax=Haliotis asinina TaxID=109174 RepID=UPI0035324B05
MMENISFQNDTETFLHDYDDRYALQVLPAILFLVVLMLLGSLGNSLVCYVYSAKFKPRTTNRYIIALAIFDLINCGICIPHEIADMRHKYTLARYGLCKVMRVIMAFTTYASGSILLAVAVDRYRKLCRPFQRQSTWLDAKVTITMCSVMSLIVALPAAVIFGEMTVATDNININGSDCSIADDYRGTPYVSIYTGAQFFLFVAVMVCLVVLYSLIWRQVDRRTTFFNKNRARQNPEQQIHKPVVSFSVQSDDVENTCVTSESETRPSTDKQSSHGLGGCETDEEMSSPKVTSTVLIPPADTHAASTPITNPSSGSKLSQKTLFMMFLITLVFVLSFLPHLSLMAARHASKETFAGIQGVGRMLYSLFLRSYFINSVANPIIYGFCNVYFRREVRLLWRKVICYATGTVSEGSLR